MKLKTIPYPDYECNLLQSGKHILAQLRGENIIVYQAFNPHIADFALKNQQFGGPHYSFSRMSWIKPNFLWMMYRAGWASKPGQERILAIEIGLDKFEHIFNQAVISSYQPDRHETRELWTDAVKNSEVRLQWDPDHDPHGKKLERRAVQLGMKGQVLKSFATEWIVSIEDITDFVARQKVFVDSNDLANLQVAREQVVQTG